MRPFDSRDVVAALYRGVLGREASEPELGLWQAALDSGLPLDAVVQEFLRSPEFDIRSSGGNLTDGAKRELGRAAALGRIDVSPLNGQDPEPPVFAPVVSQVASFDQFDHPDFRRWHELLALAQAGNLPFAGWARTERHRKVWEWAFLLQAANQHGVLVPGRQAIGFGVGNEPIPALLASLGLRVLATDQAVGDRADWQSTGCWLDSGELLEDLGQLWRPQVLSQESFRRLVTAGRLDMNDVDPELGKFDLVWSSCALEHLGTPELGLQFVMKSARLLAPGGVAVHTTELDLVPGQATADWGHLACYQPADIRDLARWARREGLEMQVNLHVPMDSPADRFVSLRF